MFLALWHELMRPRAPFRGELGLLSTLLLINVAAAVMWAVG